MNSQQEVRKRFGIAFPALKLKKQPPPLPDHGLLRPGELESYANLLIFAKTTVEGLYAGKHFSRRLGSSAEFVDYKNYTPGDDIARIDWRIFARHRKLVERKYREETDMTIYLVVDRSASMRYTSIPHKSKFLHTARIAASLAYLMINQGDKAALALFADHVSDYLPPGSTKAHLFNLVSRLESAEFAKSTDLGSALRQCEGLFRKPGKVVILSDFLDEPEGVLDAASRFTHRGYEVLFMQILDTAELTLPDVELAKFVDLETGEHLSVEPREFRASYEKTIREHLGQLADQCDRRRIHYRYVSSSDPYTKALEAYLGFQQERRA